MKRLLEPKRKPILLEINHEYDRISPLPGIPSFLVTLAIMQFLDRDDVFDFLQKCSHNSRTYGMMQLKVLLLNLRLETCLPGIYNKRATATILSLYGNADTTLQTLQVLSSKSRDYCKQEKNNWEEILVKPAYYSSLSPEARQWESTVT